MRTYEYRGFDSQGHARRGLVEALSLKGARERLAADGVLAERLSPTGRRGRFPAGERSVVYREMAALLSAGMPLVKALDTLIRSPELAACGGLLAGVRDRVREGASLADALSEASVSVGDFESAVLGAAEQSGTVPEMLEHVAGFLDQREALNERVRSALIYPCIVAVVGFGVAFLMLGVLLPRARDILSGSRNELPALTRFMIGLGHGLTRWAPVFLAGAMVTALAVRGRLARDPAWRRRWSRRLLRLPLWGRGQVLLINLRFARTLAVLLQGGVPVVDAVPVAGRATGNAWVAQRAAEEAETIRHGARLSEAVRRIAPLSASLPGWIETGEAGSGMGPLLQTAARRYEERWTRFVGRSLSLLEPALILLIGGFVLLVTLSVLLPILSLTKGLS